MSDWTFRVFRSANGRSDVLDWFEALQDDDQAIVIVRLEYLRQQPRPGWRRPHFDMLKGECAGLGEIRLKLGKVQLRPIGFFGPNRMEFTVLIVAEEKDRKFNPRTACKTAQRRKAEIEKDPGQADEWDF